MPGCRIRLGLAKARADRLGYLKYFQVAFRYVEQRGQFLASGVRCAKACRCRLGYLKNGRIHLGCAGTRVARCCCAEARYVRFQVALVRLGRVGFLLHGFQLACGPYPAAVWQPDGALGRDRAVRCR